MHHFDVGDLLAIAASPEQHERGLEQSGVIGGEQSLVPVGMGTTTDIEHVEINKAFAAQEIPSYQDLGIDLDRLNVNGGAMAVGHPFGMAGARITTTLIHSLRYHDKCFGLRQCASAAARAWSVVRLN